MGLQLQADTIGACISNFNQTTGIVSHVANVPCVGHYYAGGQLTELYIGRHLISGLDFSSTGEHLFVASLDTTLLGAGGYASVQIDLSSANADSMRASTLPALSFQAGMGSIWAADTTGPSLMLGPDGLLYLRSLRESDSYLFSLGTSPIVLSDPQFIDQEIAWYSGLSWPTGFPLFSKRYQDSEPLWLGADVKVKRDVHLRVRPNPLSDYSLLEILGTKEQPDRLVWANALGRCIRDEVAYYHGGSTLLQRGALPTGLYLVTAWKGAVFIGQVRVVVD